MSDTKLSERICPNCGNDLIDCCCNDGETDAPNENVEYEDEDGNYEPQGY